MLSRKDEQNPYIHHNFSKWVYKLWVSKFRVLWTDVNVIKCELLSTL